MSNSIRRRIMKPMYNLFCLVAVLGYCIPNEAGYLTEISEEIDSAEFGQHKGSRSTNCTCGTTNRAKGRIVGGKEADVNEYPHMVAILRIYESKYSTSYQQYCGGTIISEKCILTAAHCTVGETRPLGILPGAHYMRASSSGLLSDVDERQLYKVSEIINHPDYDDNTVKNDIALLVTAKPIKYSDQVRPACLPHAKPDLVRKYVKVSGWGDLKFEGESSDKLMKVWLKVIDLRECASKQSSINVHIDTYKPTQFCTFGWKKDSCQGDSGGPVTWLDEDTNRYTVVGVVSFGYGCASTYPGINTDVYAYINWIQYHNHRVGRGLYKTCAKV